MRCMVRLLYYHTTEGIKLQEVAVFVLSTKAVNGRWQAARMLRRCRTRARRLRSQGRRAGKVAARGRDDHAPRGVARREGARHGTRAGRPRSQGRRAGKVCGTRTGRLRSLYAGETPALPVCRRDARVPCGQDTRAPCGRDACALRGAARREGVLHAGGTPWL